MIDIANLRVCRVNKGERFTYQDINDISKMPYYFEMLGQNLFDVAVPCAVNRLLVIDVDVPSEATGRTTDGRPWWKEFCEKHGIPSTYTVISKNGGRHFYFELPSSIDERSFRPKAELAMGVEAKFNGTVHAPPTVGYQVHPQAPRHIEIVPAALLAEVTNRERTASADSIYRGLRKTFSENQVMWLRKTLPWVQQNVSLTRAEWRDGVFSIKAGTEDNPMLGEELVTEWTKNLGYAEGDEAEAISIYEKADARGLIGPGTIISMIQQFHVSAGAPIDVSDVLEGVVGITILEKAGVKFDLNKKGDITFIDNETNCSLILDQIIPKKDLYFDTRHDNYVYKGKVMDAKEIIANVSPLIQQVNGGLGFEKVKRGNISSAIDMILYNRQYDPHEEWVKSLVWDGVPRIEKFFETVCGVESSEYHRLVGKNMFTALAARALRKGSKFDVVIILEGAEGARKSSLISQISRGYLYVARGTKVLTGDDSLRQMHQSVAVEFPEMVGIRNEDPEVVKAFVSTTKDKIRGLYERKAMDRERGFLLFGTTNQREYLKKTLGYRRWWNVTIPTGHIIDSDYVDVNIEQLYAEGAALYRSGHAFWDMPKELLLKEQSGKHTLSHLTAQIKRNMEGRVHGATTLEVFQQLLADKVINGGGFMSWAETLETELSTFCKAGHDGVWVPLNAGADNLAYQGARPTSHISSMELLS